ncbi:lmo0937 family membrane protein [Camelliibacillus cellulosilyticus]|uniref:Lmo0937 family membrane protein n=1 Tax=Camelliibacillus cellulosilyticus TaxID=2174486 RepID=A0ABV9GQA2_9BACL
MLWTIFGILIVIWLLGIAFHIATGLIHIVLVIAIIVLIIKIVKSIGRGH